MRSTLLDSFGEQDSPEYSDHDVCPPSTSSVMLLCQRNTSCRKQLIDRLPSHDHQSSDTVAVVVPEWRSSRLARGIAGGFQFFLLAVISLLRFGNVSHANSGNGDSGMRKEHDHAPAVP